MTNFPFNTFNETHVFLMLKNLSFFLQFGYNKEEDNESIDDEYEEFGNDYEDEEEYDDELDDEVEEDDDVDDDEDADDDDDVDDDDDDEETDDDDDDDDDNDEESDEDEDDDKDDDDEVDDDDDDEEENEFDGGSDDWLRRRKRGARGRGNLRCKLVSIIISLFLCMYSLSNKLFQIL